MKKSLFFKIIGGTGLLCSMFFLNITAKADNLTNAVASWKLENGIWKYYGEDKILHKGWLFSNDSWYYLDRQSGDMKTGWIKEGNTWYFLNPVNGSEQGKMLTGWQWIDGKCYFFEDKNAEALGAMYADIFSPDGYKLGTSGAWVDNDGKEYSYSGYGVKTRVETALTKLSRNIGNTGKGKSGSYKSGKKNGKNIRINVGNDNVNLKKVVEQNEESHTTTERGRTEASTVKVESRTTSSTVAVANQNKISTTTESNNTDTVVITEARRNETGTLTEVTNPEIGTVAEETNTGSNIAENRQELHTPSNAEAERPAVPGGQVSNESKTERFEETTGLPVKFDLRNVNGDSYVTPVKNQYYDGGCRSFAALAALESHIKLKEGIELDLSENNMENRHGFVFKDRGVKLKVREGRNRESDLSYFISGRGPIEESDDRYIPSTHEFIPAPYLSVEEIDEIRNDSDSYISKQLVESEAATPVVKNPVRTVLGFEFLKSLDSANITSSDDVQMKQIKEAIQENGAVVSNIYMEHDGNKTFPYSNARTYNHETKAYCSLRSGVLANHAIAIVGWDDDFSKENFPEESRPDIDGAWIVKDAQTKYFGDEGYFYVSFKSTQMGTDVYVFTDVRAENEFTGVYQHDDYGLTGFVSHDQFSGDAKTILFNRYKVGASNTTLDSVGFYTTKPNAEYGIYFIRDFDDYISEIKDEGFFDETEVEEKLNEDNKLIMSGTMSKAGYHTLELPEEYKLMLNRNEVFAFGIYIKNDDTEDPDHKWDMAVEMNDRGNPSVNHGANAIIGKGETYTISFGEINDLKMLEAGTGKGINACIKVYCK